MHRELQESYSTLWDKTQQINKFTLSTVTAVLQSWPHVGLSSLLKQTTEPHITSL